MHTQQQFKAAETFAQPLVDSGMDWQKVQWEVLNHFDWLTNSEDDEEFILEVIRKCEDNTAEFREPCA